MHCSRWAKKCSAHASETYVNHHKNWHRSRIGKIWRCDIALLSCLRSLKSLVFHWSLCLLSVGLLGLVIWQQKIVLNIGDHIILPSSSFLSPQLRSSCCLRLFQYWKGSELVDFYLSEPLIIPCSCQLLTGLLKRVCSLPFTLVHHDCTKFQRIISQIVVLYSIRDASKLLRSIWVSI